MDYLYDGEPVIDAVDCPPPPAPDSLATVTASGKGPVLYYRVAQNEDQLPSSLGEGNLFVSALKVVLTPAGEKISHLSIVLSFLIPEGPQDDELTVVHWNGSEWELVPGGSVVGNYFVIIVSSPGVYVLVSK